jgi:DNA-binding transcriptional regulator GbsR (MarR family)
MEPELIAARENFIQGLSRIANFWGLPKVMGAVYGVIYLSPSHITLDKLVEEVGISKGAASTNVRSLERLGMIHKQFKVGDRKDYYVAETDFWKIARGILREREKNEFDIALRTVSESLEEVQKVDLKSSELGGFYQQRIMEMKKFFDSLDNLVATIIALDELRSGAIKKLFGKYTGK